jgi:YVTN family beta-propeller protein
MRTRKPSWTTRASTQRLRAASVAIASALVWILAAAAPAGGTHSTGELAYVTNFRGGSVSVVDTSTNTVTATIPVGCGPEGAAVTRDGAFVYVANQCGGNVSVIDASSNTVTATVGVGFQPRGVAATPDGAFVYVTNAGSDNISVINTSTNTVTATISAGDHPVGVEVTPDGSFVYVGNFRSNNVSVIATSSNTVIATVPAGSGPWGVALTPDGAFVYVANRLSNSVSVIDTSSNAVTATIPVGGAPFGVAVAPDSAFVYVSNSGSSTVSVIDTSSNTVVATVPVGSNPFGVGVTHDGAFVYVANFGSNNVSVIDTSSNTVTATVPVGNGPVAFGQFIGPAPSRPATLTLSPGADTNPVGTSHTVTATVTDVDGNPLAGIVVRFSVTGSVTASGTCTTGPSGQCDFSYTGPQLPGADSIIAYADTDEDGMQDAGEPGAEATKAWELPASTPGSVSGGGTIEDSAGNKIAFGFSAKNENQGLTGSCNVIDHAADIKLKCENVTSFTITGNQATIFGNATVNGVATTYRIDVVDNADPGKGADTFSIQTASGYSRSGTLTGGNVQVG